MARYKGPMAKVCRRLGVLISRSTGVTRAYARRETLPNVFRRKPSEYALRLMEKQKLRYYYGLSEKQMRRLYRDATRQGGNAGHNLLVLLERRLDNATCNMRFGRTVADARQLISHGHLTVNGQKVDVPSYRVKENDIIGVCKKENSRTRVSNAIESVGDYDIPDWIVVDDKELNGKITRLPTREDVRCLVEEQKVIEFYSR